MKNYDKTNPCSECGEVERERERWDYYVTKRELDENRALAEYETTPLVRITCVCGHVWDEVPLTDK